MSAARRFRDQEDEYDDYSDDSRYESPRRRSRSPLPRCRRSSKGRSDGFHDERLPPQVAAEADSGFAQEALDQTMEIPEEADFPFLQQILRANSTFPLRLHQQTKVRASLGLSEQGGLRRPVVVLSGSEESLFPDCRSRIEELFHANQGRQEKLLQQFCANDAAQPSRPASTIARPAEGELEKVVDVPKAMCRHLMTAANKAAIMEVTGSEPEWQLAEMRVLLRGSAEQLSLCVRLLSRVMTHCLWGSSEEKIMRLLKPGHVNTMLVRLSPMGLVLKPTEKILNGSEPTLSIGKDKSNDVVISDQLVSRQHCVLEIDFDRGGVYIVNLSTNGAFLNGHRLPEKNQGKVLVSHGDELLLKDPLHDAEFGYVVNLVDHTVRVWEVAAGSDMDSVLAEKLRRRNRIGCGN